MSAADAGAPDAATAMDRIYRHQRFIYDLTRKYYLLGRDRLVADLVPARGHVLEIGCGTGRNLAAIARRDPAARLYGLDVSAAMLETAQAVFSDGQFGAPVRTALADATTFDPKALFGRSGFDRVFMSYTLSMIPDWQAALERAAAALSPGGRLLIVDFGRQEGLPGVFRRLLFAWLALFHVHPIDDLPDALVGLATRHGLSLDLRRPFRGYAVYAVLDARR